MYDIIFHTRNNNNNNNMMYYIHGAVPFLSSYNDILVCQVRVNGTQRFCLLEKNIL